MRMFLSWDFKFKHGKVEETQFFKNFEKETNFSSNKSDVSGRIKVDNLRYSWCTIWQMRMFLFCDFIVKYVKIKLEKGEETQFCKNFEKETNFSSIKNDLSGRVRMDSLRC